LKRSKSTGVIASRRLAAQKGKTFCAMVSRYPFIVSGDTSVAFFRVHSS
jgi:hypothetical protein